VEIVIYLCSFSRTPHGELINYCCSTRQLVLIAYNFLSNVSVNYCIIIHAVATCTRLLRLLHCVMTVLIF